MRKTIRLNRMLKDTPVLKILLTNAVLFAALAFTASAQAADKLFDLILTAPLEAGVEAGSNRADSSGVVGQVSFPSVLGDELEIGEVFDITLPLGTVVSGEVIMESGAEPAQGTGEAFLTESDNAKVIMLGDSEGSLEVHLVGSTVAGITLNDTDNGKIYRARLNENGTGDLAEIDPDSILCFEMPLAPDEGVTAETLARIPSGLTESVVRNLESRPGATNTIYIDNWGGVYEGSAWNGGSPINYTPYSNDDDTTSFSSVDISYIWLAWAEMAEDYADFDVNVTTKTSAYESAPVANRSRIIATTTCAWYNNCGAGGVAYVGVFNNNSDRLKTGWTWNRSPGSLGMTHSHEAGHQMGLSHDATNTLGYYGGHGPWGPIMGAPFNRPYVQWSKGEYPNANNTEDDLSILSSVLGIRADDVGDSRASANELVATTGTNFMITQDGITPDTDVFAFTLNAPQEVSIDVVPTLAAGNESRAANAALNVDLTDSAGTVIASMESSDNSPLVPDTNTFSNTSTLGAGTYYLTVDAVSPNTNWATGFGEYGNGGEYRLTVDIDSGPGPEPTNPGIVSPASGATLAGYTDTFSWVANGTDVAAYWVYVGSGSGKSEYGYSGSLSSSTLSFTSTGLPLDGSAVYVTLFWLEEGAEDWQSTEYKYTAAKGDGPAFTSPASGQTLAGVSENFVWSDNDSGATQYWLYLGSKVGSKDYYNSGLIDTATSQNVQFMAADADNTVTYLPTDGSTVYGRLWYRATSSNTWLYIDDTFVAATSGGPTITSPVPSSSVPGSPATLSWESGGANVSEWWVYVGTDVGLKDVYDSGSLGSSLSASVPMPTADGSTAHVTLWFKINGTWRKANYVYQVSSDT